MKRFIKELCEFYIVLFFIGVFFAMAIAYLSAFLGYGWAYALCTVCIVALVVQDRL